MEKDGIATRGIDRSTNIRLMHMYIQTSAREQPESVPLQAPYSSLLCSANSRIIGESAEISWSITGAGSEKGLCSSAGDVGFECSAKVFFKCAFLAAQSSVAAMIDFVRAGWPSWPAVDMGRSTAVGATLASGFWLVVISLVLSVTASPAGNVVVVAEGKVSPSKESSPAIKLSILALR